MMPKPGEQLQPFPGDDDSGVIQHLRDAILGGKHWYIALLEAIALYPKAEEDHNGSHYRYLIDGEAFDWLLLAERLCQEIGGLIPEDEKLALLFHGKPPIELTSEEFRDLIGGPKHHAYLNYFYGITVEEALLLLVEDEVRKEYHSSALCMKEDAILNEAYRRIYGADMMTLLNRFREEKDYPQCPSITLPEQREFTYWLFKYRLKQCDKSRVASDTKRALTMLKHQQASKRR
jgi:hypothetical protein